MNSPEQQARPRFIRILLVENDDNRYAYFKAATPPLFRLVHAKTGGAALAILARDEPDTYAGRCWTTTWNDRGTVPAPSLSLIHI